jgi:hypothetical protein
VRPVAFAAPPALTVETTSATGSAPLEVQTGFAGPFAAVGWGLAAPDTRAGEEIATTTQGPVLTAEDPGTDLVVVDVPEEAQLLAGETANADGGAAGTDLDLYLFRDPTPDGDLSDAVLVAQQADADADERIVVPLPQAGRYVFATVGYTTATPVTTYDMTTWLVADPAPDRPEPPPGLVVTGEPPAAAAGGRVTLQAGWSGVDAPGTHLGLATLHDSASPTVGNLRASTLVEVRRR